MSEDQLINTHKDCIICFELVDTQQTHLNKFIDCSHADSFHVACIDMWVDKCRIERVIPVCPICRQELVEQVKRDDSKCGDKTHLAAGCCCFFISCCVASVLHL